MKKFFTKILDYLRTILIFGIMKKFFTKILDYLRTIKPVTWVKSFIISSLIFGILFYLAPSDIWRALFVKDRQSTVTVVTTETEGNSIMPDFEESTIERKTEVEKNKSIKKNTNSKKKKSTIVKRLAKPLNQNADLLALINGGEQEIIYAENSQEDEEIIDNREWQDVLEDYQEVNAPVRATRILPREYVISAILIDKVVTQIAGTARFQVDSDVFAKSGNNILIPKGSIGLLEYKSAVASGETRVTMEVVRITTPNNLLIIFTKKPNLSDAEGAQGIPGAVDNKYASKYGVPLLFSLLNNSANLLSVHAIRKLFGSPTDPDQSAAVNNLQETLTDQNTTILNELLKNINTNPIITVNAGSPLTIKLLQDVYFEKPEKNRIYLSLEENY